MKTFLILIFLISTISSNHNNIDCSVKLELNDKGNILLRDKIISDQKLENLVVETLKSCKSEYNLKIISSMPLDYQNNYERVEQIILNSIEIVQSEYAQKHWNKDLRSLTTAEYEKLQEIYPGKFEFSFCCSDD